MIEYGLMTDIYAQSKNELNLQNSKTLYFLSKYNMSIKRETRPAYHIAFLHIICTLALTGATLLFIPDSQAKNNDYCDKKFEDMMFHEVPASVQKTCENRFIYLTNKIKAEMRQNERLHSNK